MPRRGLRAVMRIAVNDQVDIVLQRPQRVQHAGLEPGPEERDGGDQEHPLDDQHQHQARGSEARRQQQIDVHGDTGQHQPGRDRQQHPHPARRVPAHPRTLLGMAGTGRN